MSIKIDISLELVESLMDHTADYCGSVLLLELKSGMETHIQRKLLDGKIISLRSAFETSWNELVQIEPDVMSLSMEDVDMDVDALINGC